jgi:hypothetical protein
LGFQQKEISAELLQEEKMRSINLELSNPVYNMTCGKNGNVISGRSCKHTAFPAVKKLPVWKMWKS